MLGSVVMSAWICPDYYKSNSAMDCNMYFITELEIKPDRWLVHCFNWYSYGLILNYINYYHV